VVVVQVGQHDRGDVVDRDAMCGHLVDEWLAARSDRGDRMVTRVEAAVEPRIVDQRHVHAGVDQEPAGVGVEQHCRDRLDELLAGLVAVHAERLRQALPGNGERQQAADARHRVRSFAFGGCDRYRHPVERSAGDFGHGELERREPAA
jgi:hypothetical protein